MKAIGVILAGGSGQGLGELTRHRSACAMPVAGSYRSIDFALSSMEYSRVGRVAVLTQHNARSLNEHLSSSKWWDFGRKRGGIRLLPPAFTDAGASWYRGTADALAQNLDFLQASHEPYVIITSGDCVYKIDYSEVLAFHDQRHADITVVVRDLPAECPVNRYGTVQLDEDGRIREFEEKPEKARSHTISCGIYVIRRRLLITLLQRSREENRYDFVQDILIPCSRQRRIYGYRMHGYWSNIASVDDYYRTNMAFLRPEVRDYFFRQYPEIHSKAADLPPAKYNAGASVRGSLLSSGCIVNGTVENSLLFRQVYVGHHCVIRNSLILNDVYIGDNTIIENCIVESGDTIQANSCYRGANGIQVVIEREDRRSL